MKRQLTRTLFHELAQEGASVPVYRELPGDLETPVSIYLKLHGEGPGFLLESVEHGEQVGRYSFLGVEPSRELQVRGREVAVAGEGHRERDTLEPDRDPLDAVAAELAPYQPLAPLHDRVQDLPYFVGGAVGFLGYDVVRAFERLPMTTEDDRGLADLHLMVADTLVAYDHARKRIVLFATVRTPPEADLDAAYDRAIAKLDRIEARLNAAVPPQPPAPGRNGHTTTPRTCQADFEAAVREAKAYITAGDIFQVVVSQRLERPTDAQPFAIYRALRRLNPSPYMFYLDLGGDPATHLIGSSPEMLVRLQGRKAEVRPIAGTRPRGHTAEEDADLVQDLQTDPKERA